MEVTFDPRRISYAELLELYWSSFPPQLPPGPGRVRSVVVTRGERQLATAQAAKRRLRRHSGEPVYTEIVPDGTFWPAERMHQKFDLQRVHPELVESLAAGADLDAFLASTAAARLNAYVQGFADRSVLDEVAREVDRSVEDIERLLDAPR